MQLRLFAPSDSEEGNLDELFAEFLESKPRAKGTLQEYATTFRRWKQWSDGASRSNRPTGAQTREILQQFDRHSVAEFLAWSIATTHGQNPARTANKYRANIRAFLTWLADRLDTPAPRLPPKRPARTAATKATFSREEIGRLYTAAGQLQDPPGWPVRLIGPKRHHWQAAIVAAVIYGMDTGTIWPAGRSTDALRWKAWFQSPTPPSRSAGLEPNPDGWLIYTRQKTGRTMERPVHPALAFQLRRLRTKTAGQTDHIWHAGPQTRGRRPVEVFQKLAEAAEIEQPVDVLTGEPIPWTIKHLRKTAATWHNTQTPGAASAVLGHMAEHSAAVTSAHYIDAAPLAARAILSLPLPEQFEF